MSITVNREALDFAKRLIDEGEYAINTQWSKNEPSPEQAAKYRDQNGAGELGKWYLAVDEGDADQYKFPLGDFRKLHRSGVVAAKRQAEQNGYTDLAEAAEELIFLFDRLNAC